MKHTKGPWTIVDFDGPMRIESKVGRIAELLSGYQATRFANARLIVAAPEMLEALIEAQIALKEITNGSCLVSVNNAINKARG